MERRKFGLGGPEEDAIRVIREKGYADDDSSAVRIALRQFAAAVRVLPPIVTLTTPFA